MDLDRRVRDKAVPRKKSKQPLDNMMNSRLWSRNGNIEGLAMSYRFSKTILQATVKGRSGGKTIFKSFKY